MNDEVISKIQRYIEKNLPEADEHTPPAEANKRKHSRWAAYEILNALMDRPYERPDVIIEDFILEMLRENVWCVVDQVTNNSYDEKTRIRYVIARNTAEDILKTCV